MKLFTIEQLRDYAGKEGRPVLVAVEGKVYDLSSSKKWAAGVHMNRHRAGRDLSADIKSAPHGLDVLDRFEMTGTVGIPEGVEIKGLRGRVESWLVSYPFFRRHPHPAIVHFPVGLLVVAPLLEAVAYFFNSERTEWAAFCCLVLGIAALPIAILTGYFTWWVNYDFAASQIIRRKRSLAWITLFLGIALVLIRVWLMPDPLALAIESSVGYFLSVVLLSLLIGYIGYLGGKLTFPYG